MLSGAATTRAPAFAQTGAATSSVIPSDTAPEVGQQIDVEIRVDVSGVNPPDNALGSFTATLDWNPAVLTYKSNPGVLSGFQGVVNTAAVASGHIIFNGIRATGMTGDFAIFRVSFDVAGAGTSTLDLGYSAMSAALTFHSLLPILTVNDGQVVAGGGANRPIFLPLVQRATG